MRLFCFVIKPDFEMGRFSKGGLFGLPCPPRRRTYETGFIMTAGNMSRPSRRRTHRLCPAASFDDRPRALEHIWRMKLLKALSYLSLV